MLNSQTCFYHFFLILENVIRRMMNKCPSHHSLSIYGRQSETVLNIYEIYRQGLRLSIMELCVFIQVWPEEMNCILYMINRQNHYRLKITHRKEKKNPRINDAGTLLGLVWRFKFLLVKFASFYFFSDHKIMKVKQTCLYGKWMREAYHSVELPIAKGRWKKLLFQLAKDNTATTRRLTTY